MPTDSTATAAAAQQHNLSPVELRGLWLRYTDHVADCDALPGPCRDDGDPPEWDASGLDHLGLRRIVRMTNHEGVETIWLRNFPGLRTALPKCGLDRRNIAGGDASISDDRLLREFTLTILGRGRGLRGRGLQLVREVCEARSLGSYYFDRRDATHITPHTFSPAERAAVTRARLSDLQWKILETIAFARRGGKLGLYGPGESWARVWHKTDRAIRMAMVGLETLGLAWRHYTPTEGTGDRKCDQSCNLIIPGPAWMARADELFTGTDARKAELREHWGNVARMRAAEVRTWQRYRRNVRRAREHGKAMPCPPGSLGLTFGVWARETLAAADRLAIVREQLDAAALVARRGVDADAKDIASGERSAIDVYLDSARRDDAIDHSHRLRADAMTSTTACALECSFTQLDPLRGLDDPALEQAGIDAKAAAEAPIEKNWAEVSAVPPEPERNQGKRKGPAHAAADSLVDEPTRDPRRGPVLIGELLGKVARKAGFHRASSAGAGSRGISSTATHGAPRLAYSHDSPHDSAARTEREPRADDRNKTETRNVGSLRYVGIEPGRAPQRGLQTTTTTTRAADLASAPGVEPFAVPAAPAAIFFDSPPPTSLFSLSAGVHAGCGDLRRQRPGGDGEPRERRSDRRSIDAEQRQTSELRQLFDAGLNFYRRDVDDVDDVDVDGRD